MVGIIDTFLQLGPLHISTFLPITVSHSLLFSLFVKFVSQFLQRQRWQSHCIQRIQLCKFYPSQQSIIHQDILESIQQCGQEWWYVPLIYIPSLTLTDFLRFSNIDNICVIFTCFLSNFVSSIGGLKGDDQKCLCVIRKHIFPEQGPVDQHVNNKNMQVLAQRR